jgi:putative transcriptional regulator
MNNKIKIERAISGLTQEQLADLVSVTRQTINAIELKKFVPSTVLALKICKVFNKTIEEVFCLEEND